MTFKELRKNANVTQVKLADKLGITQNAISMWETGNAKPETDKILKIAAFLGVSVEEVLNCFK
jgi:transcriptional regulator with XRE-family HTH domain